MRFELLQKFAMDGPLTVCITGTCMQGTIRQDSDVRLLKKSWYWPGDIVACGRAGGELVSHRFLGYLPGLHGWRVITRADNVPRADAPATVRRVLGCVTHVNDEPYRPAMTVRARAVGAYFPAIAHWLMERLSGSESSN